MSEVTVFRGKLVGKNGEAEIAFRTHFAKSGELVLEIDDLLFTNDVLFLTNDHFENETRYYEINGVSEDGRAFHTTDFLVSKCLTRLFATTDKIELAGSCSTAEIVVPVEEVHHAPVLLLFLKGLEGFNALSEQTPLGAIEIAGTTRPDDHDKVLGQIRIKADTLGDMTALDWRMKADALADHVRRVMSFGFGIVLRTPATQVWYQQTMTIYYRSQTQQRKPTMPLIKPLRLDDMFKAAVTSFFSPPVDVKNLSFAIEWFAMEATYNEVRLINVMTALENLLSSNVGDAKFLECKKFEKLRGEVRGKIREWLANNGYTPDECKTLTANMNAKLGDVNRQSFRDKLNTLIEIWRVPMDGITDDDIKAAKSARDLIVHQGHYYKEDDADQIQLWRHVCVVREIVVRIIMTAIGFTGGYQSLLGGLHWSEFPPKPTVTLPAPGENA